VSSSRAKRGSPGVVLHGGDVRSMGNGGEGHRLVVVATGSWFGEEWGDDGELIDVEVGPNGSRWQPSAVRSSGRMEQAPPSGFIAVFGPTTCGQNCDCSRRNDAQGGYSVRCRDGLPVHSYNKVADAVS
jgi:hypothetical protein